MSLLRRSLANCIDNTKRKRRRAPKLLAHRLTSVVLQESLAIRWCRLRPRCEERGGGDGDPSLTTSDEADRPQPAPALRVAGGEPASASLPLLNDVPRRLRRGASHLPARRPQRMVRDF